jgi:hypothetical protein
MRFAGPTDKVRRFGVRANRAGPRHNCNSCTNALWDRDTREVPVHHPMAEVASEHEPLGNDGAEQYSPAFITRQLDGPVLLPAFSPGRRDARRPTMLLGWKRSP